MKLIYKVLIFNALYFLICYFYLFDRANFVSVNVEAISSSLIAISSVVLAIIGMWISYAYPNTRSSLMQEDHKVDLVETLEGAKKLESMVMAVLSSAFILGTCLLCVSLIFPIIDSYSVVSEGFFKSFKYCFIWYLCFFQTYSLFNVVSLNFDFLNRLDLQISRSKLEKKNNKV